MRLEHGPTLIPDANMNFGVYIHIPFCRTKCNYCGFISRPWQEELAERYWRAVVREIEAFFNARPEWNAAATIYFGGGTPSLVPASHIRQILEACRRQFEIPADCEMSLEANPGTLTKEKAREYRAAGINRISMGAQTFDDRELVAIGRVHTSDQISESLALLRNEGFDNLNLDLILGLPGQTREGWLANLNRIVELRPPHISVYMLDLDPKAPLYHAVSKGLYSVPDDDAVCDWYLESIDQFEHYGYEQYEISNFALSGYACRHNLRYWERQPVLGFGVGSHSFDGRSRYANLPKLGAYMNRVESEESPIEWKRQIEETEQLQENLFLRLRLNKGIDWDLIRREYGDKKVSSYESSLRFMSDSGLVEWSNSHVRLTPRGMLLSNEVFQEFV